MIVICIAASEFSREQTKQNKNNIQCEECFADHHFNLRLGVRRIIEISFFLSLFGLVPHKTVAIERLSQYH